jgi:hypothetical protein
VNQPAYKENRPAVAGIIAKIALATAVLLSAPVFAQQNPHLTPGNLVVVVEGCGVHGGTCTAVPNGAGTGAGNSSAGGYGDNQAGPLTLFQYAPVGTTTATFQNSLVLPQTASGANLPISGEYGSSSEGTIQLSGSGRYLTVMGYGVNAAAFDVNPVLFGAAPSNALGQSGSLTGQSYTPVPRVLALIDGNGNVNSSTGLFNIFNTNNPRSAFTANGTTAYVSGQGSGSDATGGVFFTPLDIINNAATPITGLDTTGNTISQDTRDVQIVNNTLYISVDTKGGSNSARSYIGTLGSAGSPPTTTFGGPVMLSGYGNSGGTGKVTITTGANSIGNNLNSGAQINLSPIGYFFASPSVLYVADGGNPKNNSNPSPLGDGGLQKWTNSHTDGSGTWSLAYTLYKGLNLVANTGTSGSTGLYGLAGMVSGSSVLLYATNVTIGDLDQTFLYGITDTLTFTTASQAANETFTVLDTAPKDSNFKGVSFAPTAAPPVTPAITWASPGTVNFGSALSSEQLNATTNVAGTFVYNPPVGTVLSPGANQTLSVTFMPTDIADFTSATATTTITVNPAATPASPANLTVTKVLTRSGGNVVAQITITNIGGTAASNVVLTAVKIGADAATPLPKVIGTIPAGASAFATVSVPASVGTAGAASSMTVSGTYTGETFGAGARITLP